MLEDQTNTMLEHRERHSISESPIVPESKSRWGINLRHVRRKDSKQRPKQHPLPFGFPRLKRLSLVENKPITNEQDNASVNKISNESYCKIDINKLNESFEIERKSNLSNEKSNINDSHLRKYIFSEFGHSSTCYQPNNKLPSQSPKMELKKQFPPDSSSARTSLLPSNKERSFSLQDLLKEDELKSSFSVLDTVITDCVRNTTDTRNEEEWNANFEPAANKDIQSPNKIDKTFKTLNPQAITVSSESLHSNSNIRKLKNFKTSSINDICSPERIEGADDVDTVEKQVDKIIQQNNSEPRLPNIVKTRVSKVSFPTKSTNEDFLIAPTSKQTSKKRSPERISSSTIQQPENKTQDKNREQTVLTTSRPVDLKNLTDRNLKREEQIKDLNSLNFKTSAEISENLAVDIEGSACSLSEDASASSTLHDTQSSSKDGEYSRTKKLEESVLVSNNSQQDRFNESLKNATQTEIPGPLAPRHLKQNVRYNKLGQVILDELSLGELSNNTILHKENDEKSNLEISPTVYTSVFENSTPVSKSSKENIENTIFLQNPLSANLTKEQHEKPQYLKNSKYVPQLLTPPILNSTDNVTIKTDRTHNKVLTANSMEKPNFTSKENTFKKEKELHLLKNQNQLPQFTVTASVSSKINVTPRGSDTIMNGPVSQTQSQKHAASQASSQKQLASQKSSQKHSASQTSSQKHSASQASSQKQLASQTSSQKQSDNKFITLLQRPTASSQNVLSTTTIDSSSRQESRASVSEFSISSAPMKQEKTTMLNSKPPSNGDQINMVLSSAAPSITASPFLMGSTLEEQYQSSVTKQYPIEIISTSPQNNFNSKSAKLQDNSVPSQQTNALSKQNGKVGKLIIMSGGQRDEQIKNNQANLNSSFLPNLTNGVRHVTLQKQNHNGDEDNGDKDDISLSSKLKSFHLEFESNKLEELQDNPNTPPYKVPEIVFNGFVEHIKSILWSSLDDKFKKKNKRKKLKVNFEPQNLTVIHSYPSETSLYEQFGEALIPSSSTSLPTISQQQSRFESFESNANEIEYIPKTMIW